MSYQTKYLNKLEFYYNIRKKTTTQKLVLFKQNIKRLQATHNRSLYSRCQVCSTKVVAYRACKDRGTYGLTDRQTEAWKMNDLSSLRQCQRLRLLSISISAVK